MILEYKDVNWAEFLWPGRLSAFSILCMTVEILCYEILSHFDKTKEILFFQKILKISQNLEDLQGLQDRNENGKSRPKPVVELNIKNLLNNLQFYIISKTFQNSFEIT